MRPGLLPPCSPPEAPAKLEEAEEVEEDPSQYDGLKQKKALFEVPNCPWSVLSRYHAETA